MECKSCAFETERLTVHEWQAHPISRREEALGRVVASILTEPVTRALPTEWQGKYDEGRTAEWIAARNSEGPTLLVSDRITGEGVGLVILFESIAECGTGVDVRLGYVLAERAWGQGLATELVGGFVSWCRSRAEIRSLVGGVAKTNPASARVLEKNGFLPVEEDRSDPGAEQIYRLSFGS